MTQTRALLLGALALFGAVGVWAALRPAKSGDLCQTTGALSGRADYAAMAALAFTNTAFSSDGATVIRVIPGDLVAGDALRFPGHFAEISTGDILHIAPFEVEVGESLIRLRSAEVAAQLGFTPCGMMEFQQWYASRDDEVFDWPQAPLDN